MASQPRRATVADLHRVAAGMPHTRVLERGDRPIYQVGQRSFAFFRTPRPDAVDETTGERLDDVVVLWVASEEEKRMLLGEPGTPLFTTPHFDGHPSVLLRVSRIGELDVEELTELVQDAWLAQASKRRAAAWLREHGLAEPDSAGSRPGPPSRSSTGTVDR